MKDAYLNWLSNEVNDAKNELTEYYNSLEINIEHKINDGNLIELIRATNVKLKTLESAKRMYQVYHNNSI